MSAETVPGTETQYHLIAFDARGRERVEAGGSYDPDLLRHAAGTRPTDVFLFSHGWNADVQEARTQYRRWITAMESCADDLAALAQRPGGYRPLLVGLHWPSKAWSDDDLSDHPGGAFDVQMETGPQDAAAFSTAHEEPGAEIDWYVDHYAALLTDTPETRKALGVILQSALLDAAPPTLPEPVREAYEAIDAEAGSNEGAGAAPGEDRRAFDAQTTYAACQQEEFASFGGLSLGGILSPLRVLTFWQMKRRARTFGESGAATLLGDLREAAPTARFHLMGHSFGCIVVCAAAARATGGRADRPLVDTLVLVQGAMSLWSFCSSIPARPDRPGYFHRLLADGRVGGPVLATTSVHDRAVRTFYPLGAGAADQVDYEVGRLPTYGGMGTFGVHGPGIGLQDRRLGPVGTVYDFRPQGVYNLDADDVIKSGEGFSGAHSDICHPPVAHAIWQAVQSNGR
ncbi:hypothetical protein ACFTUC_30105 [Streptomyces sp. NPDC056944]|uniref:hypothetical protein n=1 Tax=Streptomyces sp. NPDC056944 TaxID=3345972 RepID=UPI00362CC12A